MKCLLMLVIASASLQYTAVLAMRKATVTLTAYKPYRDTVEGKVKLIQAACQDPVRIVGSIWGMSEGAHGLHIHENTDCGLMCHDAGPHFNPTNAPHGGLESVLRHAGDLGNVQARYNHRLADTLAKVNVTNDMISLCKGANDVRNRTMMVHLNEDDLGTSDHPYSRITGNPGPGIACGTILADKLYLD